MTDIKTEADKDEKFLDDLEEGILKVLNSRKASNAEKVAAANAGIRLAAIKYKIAGGDVEPNGFFDKN
jgi:hypothetical protein